MLEVEEDEDDVCILKGGARIFFSITSILVFFSIKSFLINLFSWFWNTPTFLNTAFAIVGRGFGGGMGGKRFKIPLLVPNAGFVFNIEVVVVFWGRLIFTFFNDFFISKGFFGSIVEIFSWFF